MTAKKSQFRTSSNGRDLKVSAFHLAPADDKCPRHMRLIALSAPPLTSFGFVPAWALRTWRDALRDWVAAAHGVDPQAGQASFERTKFAATRKITRLGPDVTEAVDRMAQTYSSLVGETPLYLNVGQLDVPRAAGAPDEATVSSDLSPGPDDVVTRVNRRWPNGLAGLLRYGTPFPKRQLVVSGTVDIRGIDANGELVLRCFRYKDQSPSDRLLETQLLALRLFVETNNGGEPLERATIEFIDLVRAQRYVQIAELKRAGHYAAALDANVARIQRLIDDGTARMGSQCGHCEFQVDCPALESDLPKVQAANQALGNRRPSSDLVSTPVPLSPTSVETWRRCRRQFRNRHLLSLPEFDKSRASLFGTYVHEMLRLLHSDGRSCKDRRHVTDLLDAYATDDRAKLEAMIERHIQRCPAPRVPHADDDGPAGAPPTADNEIIGLEVSRTRAHFGPPTAFNATARFDALWRRDGVLEARDYKTGQRLVDRVADDVSARVQAWILEPQAAREGRQLVVRQEFLEPSVGEDPEPFVPDAHDFEEIGEFLGVTAYRIASETEFRGDGEAEVCSWCPTRETCPDRKDPDTSQRMMS